MGREHIFVKCIRIRGGVPEAWVRIERQLMIYWRYSQPDDSLSSSLPPLFGQTPALTHGDPCPKGIWGFHVPGACPDLGQVTGFSCVSVSPSINNKCLPYTALTSISQGLWRVPGLQ